MRCHRHGDHKWGARFVVQHTRRIGQIVPLWAESGKWGPQRHPATPGKPWSVRRRRRVSGCRISVHAFSAKLSQRVRRAHRLLSSAHAPSTRTFTHFHAQARLQLLATAPLHATFFDTLVRAFLLHSLGLPACYRTPVALSHVLGDVLTDVLVVHTQ